jgi:hypothetical protein
LTFGSAQGTIDFSLAADISKIKKIKILGDFSPMTLVWIPAFAGMTKGRE